MTVGMTWLFTIALLFLAGAEPAQQTTPQPVQSFRLEPGDFRWIPFTVRQTPTGVDCRYEVVTGGATVHAELLPMSEFRLFDRGREHDTMALTPKARSGEFRRVIDTRGQYAVVIVNEAGAPAVMVSLHVETNVNPSGADVAKMLSPQRRLTVILISFAFFFVTVSWSGRKLILAMRRAEH
jgi:hypothetical protein